SSSWATAACRACAATSAACPTTSPTRPRAASSSSTRCERADGASLRRELFLHVVERVLQRLDARPVLVAHLEAVLLIDRQLDLEERQGVEPQPLERRAGVFTDFLLGHADSVHQDLLEVVEGEGLVAHLSLLVAFVVRRLGQLAECGQLIGGGFAPG